MAVIEEGLEEGIGSGLVVLVLQHPAETAQPSQRSRLSIVPAVPFLLGANNNAASRPTPSGELAKQPRRGCLGA